MATQSSDKSDRNDKNDTALKAIAAGVNKIAAESKARTGGLKKIAGDTSAIAERVNTLATEAGSVARDTGLVANDVATIARGIETLASTGFPEGGTSAGVPVTGFDIERRISFGIASVIGVDLKAPRTTTAEVLAFAEKLKRVIGKSVIKKDRYGSTVYDLQKRGAVPADTGGTSQLRGIQATFYQQASTIRDATSELLHSLECQLRDCDEEDIDFLKETINTNVSGIVAEFGREGGALPQRVEVLFAALEEDILALHDALGIDLPADDPQSKEMDIADREENERNFKLLSESLVATRGSLQVSLQAIFGGYQLEIVKARGTLLNRLLQTIGAIPDSLQDVYDFMDAARLSAVDRRVTTFDGVNVFDGVTTIEQLLSWIEVSASEWPAQLGIGDTRVIEVKAVQRAAQKQSVLLAILIGHLKDIIPVGDARVRGALQELGRELGEVDRLGGLIIAPIIP